MNEDDTFNRLKRSTFEAAFLFVSFQSSLVGNDRQKNSEFERITGWTVEEYVEERDRRND